MDDYVDIKGFCCFAGVRNSELSLAACVLAYAARGMSVLCIRVWRM